MLETRAITKSYGAVRALSDVDFAIGRGEIVALAGENGSGKSTLAKILAGVVQPDSGELSLDGAPRSFSRPRDALDCGITMVAQDLTAVPHLSVAENVLMSRLPRPLGLFSRRRFNALAREALAETGIILDPRRLFSTLKPGEREFVEVAKALAADPRYLILDEATSRFGERDVERLFDLLRRLRDAGVSTILITHRLKEICEIAERAVVLRDGRRVGELSGKDIAEQRLTAMMVGRELRDFFHKRQVAIGSPVLEVEGLVVEGASEPVSLAVRAGEIVGVAGLVGSGRTELLETIIGIRKAGGGRLLVGGRQITLGSPRRALAAGLALVPEDRHRQGLNLVTCIRENIAMGTWRLATAQRARERALSTQAVRQLRIRTTGIEAPVRSLSGGNQQKVVVARCLTRRPGVLLLDEPTRGIDVGAKEEVFQLVGEMVGEGMGILMVSSEMVELLGLCDRIIVMHERRVVGELARGEATEERIALLSAGGGRALVA